MGYKLTAKAHSNNSGISCLFMHVIERSFDAGENPLSVPTDGFQ